MITNDNAMNQAKEALEGKKLKAAGFFILYVVIFFFLSALSNLFYDSTSEKVNPALIPLSIICTILTTIFSIGFCSYYYKIGKRQVAAIRDIKNGFKKFKRNIIVILLADIIILFPILIMGAIAAIIMPTAIPVEQHVARISIYAIIFFCLFCFLFYKTFPTFMALYFRAGIDESEGIIEMLKNTYHKISKYNFQFFCLQLKFIGWFLLCAVTLGIALFWVVPYFYTATAIFVDAATTPDDNNNNIPDESPLTLS